MTAGPMTDQDEGAGMGSRIGRILLTVALVFGAIFSVGVVIGIFAAHADKGGGPMSAKLIAILAAAALVAAGCAWFGWRSARAAHGAGGPLTTRERRNRMIMYLCFGLGLALGIGMAVTGLDADKPGVVFSDGPIPASSAIVAVLLIGVLLPLISLYWHKRVIDEQEAAAYRSGAMLGMYAFWIGAPVWWFLWRGGLAPVPDGVTIYMTTIAIALVVWLWSKYR